MRFFLFLVTGQHPHIHIFAFWPFDALDEVVGGEFFEDLVQQIRREFGPMGQILLCAGVLFDERVYFSIRIGEYGPQDSGGSIVFTLHIREIYIYRISNIIIYTRIQTAMEGQSWKQWTAGNITVSYREIVLTLRRNFNTAHSSSAQRHNFIVRLELQGSKEKGFGECGLPPKKQHCYFADVEDCETFIQKLGGKMSKLNFVDEREKVEDYLEDIFRGVPAEYFRYLRHAAIKQSPLRAAFEDLMVLLFHSRQETDPTSLPARSALQFSLLDLASRLLCLPLPQLIFPSPSAHDCCSFYTISYQSPVQMLQNAIQGLNFTSFLKIKYIDDIKGLMGVLESIQQNTQEKVEKYIIDANASWTTRSCLQFFQVLEKYDKIKQKILYLQQPFGLELGGKEIEEWQGVRNRANVAIVADQSVCNWEQLALMKTLCSGVNIKTEKAGGAINSLRTALEAKELGLEVMLGSMVSTHLGCTQTFSLHPLTRYLDVDGALLVKQPQLQGGFIWKSGGFLSLPKSSHFGTTILTEFFQK